MYTTKYYVNIFNFQGMGHMVGKGTVCSAYVLFLLA